MNGQRDEFVNISIMSNNDVGKVGALASLSCQVIFFLDNDVGKVGVFGKPLLSSKIKDGARQSAFLLQKFTTDIVVAYYSTLNPKPVLVKVTPAFSKVSTKRLFIL